MNQEEFLALRDARETLISTSMLANKTPRTLLYGYNFDRDTFHVYLDEKLDMHVLTYCGVSGLMMSHTSGPSGGVSHNSELAPSKRLYPECCDAEFSRLLANHGVDLVFTTFNADRPAPVDGYYGKTLAGLRSSVSISLATVQGLPYVAQMALLVVEEAAYELGLELRRSHAGRVVVSEDDVDRLLARAREIAPLSNLVDVRNADFYARHLVRRSIGDNAAVVESVGWHGGMLRISVAATSDFMGKVYALKAAGYAAEPAGLSGIHVHGQVGPETLDFFASPDMFDSASPLKRYRLLLPLFCSPASTAKRVKAEFGTPK